MTNIYSDLIDKGYSILKVDRQFADALEKLFGNGKEFFYKNEKEKVSCSNVSIQEGYRRLGSEYSLSEERRDLCETFSVWSGDLEKTPVENWKMESPYYKAFIQVLPFYNQIVDKLFSEIKIKMNYHGDDISFSKDSYLQMNFYQPAKHTRDFLQDEHEDGHLLTLVAATAPGIEIKVGEEYIAPDLKSDELLIMPGLIISLLTDNRIKALYHRVKNITSIDKRISLMYFVNPNLDQKIMPWAGKSSDIDIIQETINRSTAFGLDSINDARINNSRSISGN